MCEICEILEKGKDYEVYGPWTSLAIEKENAKYYICAYGEDIAKMEIIYCPMCGRKLG